MKSLPHDVRNKIGDEVKELFDILKGTKEKARETISRCSISTSVVQLICRRQHAKAGSILYLENSDL